jgi:putative membrane protein
MFERWKVKFVVLTAALLFPAGLALAAGGKEGKTSSADEKFIKQAAQGGMMETELGKIAAEKAGSDKVKEFGRRMDQDHGKVNQELKELAANKGVKLPGRLAGKQKSTVDRLAKLSGEVFDREYMRAMIDDHKEVVEKFQREAQKADDPQLKQFVSKQLPTLKKHLELARAAGQEVGAERSR